MNADEIYKKYLAPPEPPVVEQDPDPFKVMDPNSPAWSPAATAAFDIKDIQVSTDRSSSFIPLVTIRILYSVNGNWNGIATTQISQDPLRHGPGINPDLLDMATQHLINEISIEVRDRLIAKPLKEKLFAKVDELHRKGL